jgi:hypothetical protein
MVIKGLIEMNPNGIAIWKAPDDNNMVNRVVVEGRRMRPAKEFDSDTLITALKQAHYWLSKEKKA